VEGAFAHEARDSLTPAARAERAQELLHVLACGVQAYPELLRDDLVGGTGVVLWMVSPSQQRARGVAVGVAVDGPRIGVAGAF
jgi:hypothetical protein